MYWLNLSSLFMTDRRWGTHHRFLWTDNPAGVWAPCMLCNIAIVKHLTSRLIKSKSDEFLPCRDSMPLIFHWLPHDYHSSRAGGTLLPPAMLHCLQQLTARSINPIGSGKGSTPWFLGAPVKKNWKEWCLYWPLKSLPVGWPNGNWQERWKLMPILNTYKTLI